MLSKKLFKILVASYSLSTFAEGVILPIYAIFVQQIGGGILDTSGAIATFLIVGGVATIIIHRLEWSQRHRIPLLIFGWLLWVIGISSYFFISNVFTLFAAQILVALGNATADPAFDAELDDNTDTAFGWSIFEASKDILNGIAAVVGGLIAAFLGFKVLIACMVLAATISFLLILLYVRVRTRESEQKIPV